MNPPVTIRVLGRRPTLVGAQTLAKPTVGSLAMLLFIVLHVPLGLAMKLVPYVSTLHALAALAIALLLILCRYPTPWVVAACAYLVGSETLWRMTDARVFWEYGKYALFLIVAVALLFRRQRTSTYLPLLYFALLLPGALLTLIAVPNFGDLRQILSFELSGPLAYAACGYFLVGRLLTRNDVIRCLVAMLAPVAGVAAVTFFGIRTTEIQFGASANADSSGGFGPNQVAAALALGMVVCFLLLTGKNGSLLWKASLVALFVWFGIQAALTFSRSGLYYSGAAILAGTAFLVKDVRRFTLVLLFGLALVVVSRFVIAPQLDAFTGGAFERRYARTDLSGRGDLMEGDLLVFLQHPVLGVGVGLAREARKQAVGVSNKSHTEFTRLLSEHGFLGAVALALMLTMGIQAVMRQSFGWPRAFSAALLAFGLVFMTGSAMRLAIPAFLLPLAGVRIWLPRMGRATAQRRALPAFQHYPARAFNPIQRVTTTR